MHVIASQFAEERPNRNTHFRAKGTPTGNLTICQHATSNGKRRTRVKSTCANPPTTIRQDNDLIGNLDELSVCLTAGNYTQHIAVLWFDILHGSHIEQSR